MKACTAVMRYGEHSSRPTYEYEYKPAPIDLEELDPEQAELLRQLIDGSLENSPAEESTHGPEPPWEQPSEPAEPFELAPSTPRPFSELERPQE